VPTPNPCHEVDQEPARGQEQHENRHGYRKRTNSVFRNDRPSPTAPVRQQQAEKRSEVVDENPPKMPTVGPVRLARRVGERLPAKVQFGYPEEHGERGGHTEADDDVTQPPGSRVPPRRDTRSAEEGVRGWSRRHPSVLTATPRLPVCPGGSSRAGAGGEGSSCRRLLAATGEREATMGKNELGATRYDLRG
jgi:hypothetical protein